MNRLIVGQFFYDIVSSYSLNPDTAQCALCVWDRAMASEASLCARQPEAVVAASFLLAQKWSDVRLFSARSIARLCHCTDLDVVVAEHSLIAAFLSCDFLDPRAVPTRNALAFFQMSHLGAAPRPRIPLF